MPRLVIADLTLRFGGIAALDRVSFNVEDHEICALVGPNGAGKSSLFNCVTGLYRATSGSVEFGGKSVLGHSPAWIARAGIARTFQNIAFVPALNVIENVMLAASVHERAMPVACATRAPWERRGERRIRTEAEELLERLNLAHVAGREVDDLPFGTRKRIEVARALLTKPTLLLLDEPAGGLNETEVGELRSLLQSVHRDFGTSILLVEHHMGFVMSTAQKVVVLDGGRKIAEGAPAEVSRNPAVVEAYLGVRA